MLRNPDPSLAQSLSKLKQPLPKLKLLTVGVIFLFGASGVFWGSIRHSGDVFCENQRIDFGHVYRPLSEPLEHTFQITNRGPQRANLKLRPSSKHLSVKLSKLELAPGESGEVEVVWHVPARPGEELFLVDVVSDNGTTLQLSGTVKVVERLIAEPIALTFSNMLPGDVLTQDLSIIAPAGQELPKVIDCQIIGDARGALKFTAVKVTDHRLVLRIIAQGSTDSGLSKCLLRIGTSDARLPTINIPIHLDQTGYFEVLPAVVVLKPRKGAGDAQWVRLTSSTCLDFSITEMVVDAPEVIQTYHHRCKIGELVCLLKLRSDISRHQIKTGKVQVKLSADALEHIVTISYVVNGLAF